MQAYVNDFLIAFVCVLYVLAVSLGLTKMIRLVIGNYIISFIILALYSSLDMIVYQLESAQLGFITRPAAIIRFVEQFRVAIAIAVYLVLLIMFVWVSRLQFITNRMSRYIFAVGIIYAPFVVISILMSIAVVIVGADILDYEAVLVMRENLASAPQVVWFLQYTPLWYILPGLATIIISFNMRLASTLLKRGETDTNDDRVVMSVDE